MNRVKKLKPCPFCGGEAELIYWGNFNVECKVCGNGCGVRGTKEEAIAAWNRRVCCEQSTEKVAANSDAANGLGANSEKPNLSYADIEKMVKPLKFKTGNARGWTCRVAYLGKIKISVHEGWGKDAEKVFLDAEFTPEAYTCDLEAHVEAQKLIVELVAAALGVERSAK